MNVCGKRKNQVRRLFSLITSIVVAAALMFSVSPSVGAATKNSTITSTETRQTVLNALQSYALSVPKSTVVVDGGLVLPKDVYEGITSSGGKAKLFVEVNQKVDTQSPTYRAQADAAHMVDGKVYGVSVAKYAYKTITITQGTLVANPNTVNAPATKEIYLYDQFGYPLAGTQVKLQYGYKDANGNVIPAITATTNADGKVSFNFPQPYAFGTYTATISTFKSGAYVDGAVALTVSYAGGFSLGDLAMTGSIGSLNMHVISTTASISKLWISVDDTSTVLETFAAYPSGNEVDYKLAPTGYTQTFVYANNGAWCFKILLLSLCIFL